MVNPGLKGLNNLNFHPFEVVSRYRDPQLQVGENCLMSDQIFANFDVCTQILLPITMISLGIKTDLKRLLSCKF